MDASKHDEATAEHDIYQPLNLIKDVSERLVSQKIPFSQTRLEELFSHISGAVQQVLDYAQTQVDQGLQQAALATAEMVGDLDEGEARDTMEQVREEMALARSEVHSGLQVARETFFSATSFSDLQGRVGMLEHAEGRIQAGLQQLESALMMAEDPDLWAADAPVRPEVGAALDHIGESLDALQTHLEEGKREQLETALENLNQARELIETALKS